MTLHTEAGAVTLYVVPLGGWGAFNFLANVFKKF